MESHLLQMRGLKLNLRLGRDCYSGRIFYRCVDWNHFCILFISYCFKSHLLQMRGLKPPCHRNPKARDGSHLLQMRGLKPLRLIPLSTNSKSHLLQMRGLKLGTSRRISRRCSRIFYRCVDWNHSSKARLNVSLMSHPLRGQLL